MRPYFQRVHKQMIKHKALICEALEQLNSDWASFCFVKILNCNADESSSFSGAYCKTIRNVQEDVSKQLVVWIPDLFNVTLPQMVLDRRGGIENQILDKQLTACEKLAQFLDTISDTNKILVEQLEDESMTEQHWVTIVGVHVLRKLAVSNDMKIDSSYSNLQEDVECPCGCKTAVRVDDNSMGHKEVWHGSVDILLGQVAVSIPEPSPEEEIPEENSLVIELKRRKLEDARNQFITKSIIFSFAVQSGVVPLVGISKESFKVFMYDPEEDLLYESTSMPLFVEPVSVEGRQLNISSLVTLWIIINFEHFFTGVKSSHVDFGYKTDLKRFLGERQCDIYQHHVKMGGLKHVKSKVVEFNAGGNMGMFERL